MKLLFDFLPIVLFFITFKLYGIYIATSTAIIISVLQVGIFWLKNRRFENMHLITLAIITLLGGATLFFHNELFIKWKPTTINWILALAFLSSQYIGSKPLIQRLMDSNVNLPTTIWLRINTSWVIFFLLMGTANLYVAYNFDTNTWVNFKLFGVLGLTLVFVVIQAIYLTRHMSESSYPSSQEN
ncbi:MAG: septation protein A [Gammaproteobacteria bacterium]